MLIILFFNCTSVILSKPGNTFAHLAIVTFRINVIQFINIISTKIVQCLFPVPLTEDGIYIQKSCQPISLLSNIVLVVIYSINLVPRARGSLCQGTKGSGIIHRIIPSD